MKLIVQPEAGVAPVVTAIKQARKSIDILIFRMDRQEIGRALEAAVARGVNVRALIAHINSGGDKGLRKLELHLLEKGVSVSRTADDLVRYHGKLMIIDGTVLHLYGFNFTALDIEKSRSFGLITRNRKLVQEAAKLFEADSARQPYVPGNDRFIVSPENARERLGAFIKKAKKQLLVYDPKVSDPAMLKLLAERASKGVDVRIIGRLGGKNGTLAAEKYPGKRLHVRAMIRDGRHAFIGSQSLRKIELDKRREIGLVLDEPGVIRQMATYFEEDWAKTDSGKARGKAKEKKEVAEKKGGKEPGRAIAAAS